MKLMICILLSVSFSSKAWAQEAPASEGGDDVGVSLFISAGALLASYIAKMQDASMEGSSSLSGYREIQLANLKNDAAEYLADPERVPTEFLAYHFAELRRLSDYQYSDEDLAVGFLKAE